MSRTFHKKIRVGVCCGSNTEYYRNKRRSFRRKTKSLLKIQLDEFVHPEMLHQFKDRWDEPTDGTFLVDWLYIKNDVEDFLAGNPLISIGDIKEEMKTYGRYLKPTKYSKQFKRYSK